MKFWALFAASLSVLTLIGEASTIGNSYYTGFAIYSDAVHDENASVFGVTLFSMITMGYITSLLFWGMFQVLHCFHIYLVSFMLLKYIIWKLALFSCVFPPFYVHHPSSLSLLPID